jgi:hypothetical protein
MKSYQHQRASSSGCTFNNQPRRLPWRDTLACWLSVIGLNPQHRLPLQLAAMAGRASCV